MSSKRPRANSDPTLAPAPKKQRGPIPDVSTQSTSSQKTHPDRISKKDQKKETATVKAALEVHYNVIAQRLDPMECPTLPSADDFNKFLNIQYATRDEIQEALKKVRPSSEDNKKFAADVRELKVKVSSQKGRYATAYCAISVDWLTYFIASIHKLGLEHLRFDFLGSSVDSLYNETMELILIKTFSCACQGRAYDFLSVNRAIAEDFETVQSLWRSYFEFLRHEAVTEAREPGALRRRKMASYIYRHRSEKAKHRSAFLQRHGLPERVWKPFEEVFANSDEEYITEKGSNDKVITKRVRNLKIGRSATWTSLARLADQARWKEMEGMGQATKIAHEKLVIDNPKANGQPSRIGERLPLSVPVDFFLPSWFNNQPAEWRKHYENSAIGLPLDLGGDDIDCWETWLSLSESDFMRVHGKSIRENYKFPNSKELNVRRRKRKYHRPEPPKFKWKSLYGSEYDGDDDDDDDDEDDDGNGNGKGGRAREWSPMQEDQQDGDSTMEDSANGMGQEDGQPSGGSEDGSEGGTKGKRGNNQEGESDAHMDTSGGPSSPSRPTSLAANSLRPAAIGSQKSPDRPSFSSNSAASGPSANRFGPSAAATRTSYDSLDPSQVQSVYGQTRTDGSKPREPKPSHLSRVPSTFSFQSSFEPQGAQLSPTRPNFAVRPMSSEHGRLDLDIDKERRMIPSPQPVNTQHSIAVPQPDTSSRLSPSGLSLGHFSPGGLSGVSSPVPSTPASVITLTRITPTPFTPTSLTPVPLTARPLAPMRLSDTPRSSRSSSLSIPSPPPPRRHNFARRFNPFGPPITPILPPRDLLGILPPHKPHTPAGSPAHKSDPHGPLAAPAPPARDMLDPILPHNSRTPVGSSAPSSDSSSPPIIPPLPSHNLPSHISPHNLHTTIGPPSPLPSFGLRSSVIPTPNPRGLPHPVSPHNPNSSVSSPASAPASGLGSSPTVPPSSSPQLSYTRRLRQIRELPPLPTLGSHPTGSTLGKRKAHCQDLYRVQPSNLPPLIHPIIAQPIFPISSHQSLLLAGNVDEEAKHKSKRSRTQSYTPHMGIIVPAFQQQNPSSSQQAPMPLSQQPPSSAISTPHSSSSELENQCDGVDESDTDDDFDNIYL